MVSGPKKTPEANYTSRSRLAPLQTFALIFLCLVGDNGTKANRDHRSLVPSVFLSLVNMDHILMKRPLLTQC